MMTVLGAEETPYKSKLSLNGKKLLKEQFKRKYTGERNLDGHPVKKPYVDFESNMFNGYRSDQRINGVVSEGSPVANLSNMGNTCYLNSVLYTLRFIPNFLHNLHHLMGDLSMVNNRLNQNKAKTSSLGRNIGAISGPNGRSTSSKDLLSLGNCEFIPKTKVQIVTEKLHDLFVMMHNLESRETSDPFQPLALLQAVREANTIFEGNHQQDAHELLLYLLDNIRETCDFLSEQLRIHPDLLNEPDVPQNTNKMWSLRRSKKKVVPKKEKAHSSNGEGLSNGIGSPSDRDESDSIFSSENLRQRFSYNFLFEDFQGITLRRTKCLECESVTERKEPFYDIPVPIPISNEEYVVNTNVTADDIYRRACVTSEKLCDANKYLCEECMRYNEASREVLFERLPNIMILQLKRFTSSTSGVQKVNTYLPTPLELACFCQSCCNSNQKPPEHSFKLCCVIMHLGGSMASGHYISYVKTPTNFNDYSNCLRDLPKANLSASSSEKSLHILNFFNKKSSANSLLENRNGIASKTLANGTKFCKSIDCCGIKMDKNSIENSINSFHRRGEGEEMWLECDDESVRSLRSDELLDILGYKPNSTSTPYLLFYSKYSTETNLND